MHSLRQIRRAPGFAAAFVASLAIAIAATGTAAAVVKRAFFDGLPYPDADRLVTIRTLVDGRAQIGSSFQFGQALRGSPVFSHVSADWGRTVVYEAPGGAERLNGGSISADYFAVVGVAPALGHALTPGRDDEVVVSWSFFTRALGADARKLGEPIAIDGVMRRVVGVMPHDFVAPYLTEAEVWLPLDTQPLQAEAARGTRAVVLQARLADGVGLDAARAFLELFGERQRRQHPDAFAGQTWVVDRLQDVLVEPSRTLLIATAAAAGLLMVVVLANIAGLAAARAAEMRRAAAVRLALGAGHARLFRERLAESAALAGIGALLGLWLASLFIRWITAYQQQFQLFLEDVPAASFDLTVVAIGLLLGAAAAAVAAAMSQRGLRRVTADELLGRGRQIGDGRIGRMRSGAVVVQIAMTMVLLVSAGLLVRTVDRMTSAALGFNPEQVATFGLTFPAARYAGAERMAQVERDIVARLRAVPGIDAASATTRMPGTGGPQVTVTMPGHAAPDDRRAIYFTIAPGFFEFLRVPLHQGREFSYTDTPDSPAVVVVNEAMARAFWPGGHALGARFRLGTGAVGDAGPREVTVVGVVRDFRESGWSETVQPSVFESTTQRPGLSRSFAIRTSQPRTTVAGDVRAAVHGVDALLAPTALTALDARLDSQIVQQRFSRALLAIFAGIAVGLSALGLFAVISLAAHARRREYAMRMALGAGERAVAWLVLRQSLLLGVIGGAMGLVASAWLTSGLHAMLYGVAPGDPATLAATLAIMLAVALAAALPAALRVARLDPVEVLKSN